MTVHEPDRHRGDRPGDRPDTGALIRPFLGHGGDLTDDPAPGPGEAVAGPGGGVRPFLLTAGRTTGATDIAVEAQVAITHRGRIAVDTLPFEYRDIVALCDEPLAVAEIAARLSLHLGVIRVLVGDLKHQGMVTTYEPEVDPTNDVEMIVRVINGLRART